MDVIQFHDVTGREMVARWPAEGTAAIRLGSQLIVEQSQRAIFVRDGMALDTFGPGRHTLETLNLPILARLQRIPFGSKSPFQAAVIFVSSRTFLDLKWGTKDPVVFRDPELAMVRLRAFGKYAVRVRDPQLFVNRLVGSRGLYETREIEGWFKDVMVSRLVDLLGETHSSVLDLAALYDELAMGLRTRVAEDFGRFGIDLVDLVIGAITPPPEVQQMIDQRSSMAAVGDLEAFQRFQTARALGDAARNPGGGAGAAVGAGLGLGMVLPQMAGMAAAVGGAPSPGAAAAPAAEAPAAAAPAAAAPPRGHAANSGETRSAPAFCHQCGGGLPPGARFCPNCGLRLEEGDAS